MGEFFYVGEMSKFLAGVGRGLYLGLHPRILF